MGAGRGARGVGPCEPRNLGLDRVVEGARGAPLPPLPRPFCPSVQILVMACPEMVGLPCRRRGEAPLIKTALEDDLLISLVAP